MAILPHIIAVQNSAVSLQLPEFNHNASVSNWQVLRKDKLKDCLPTPAEYSMCDNNNRRLPHCQPIARHFLTWKLKACHPGIPQHIPLIAASSGRACSKTKCEIPTRGTPHNQNMANLILPLTYAYWIIVRSAFRKMTFEYRQLSQYRAPRPYC